MDQKTEEKAKPTLKVDTKIVHEVDYGDFDAFVEEVYGRSFESAADLESGNDTSHTFSVQESDKVYKWDDDKLAEFKAGKNGSYMTRHILRDLAKQGLIAYRNYSIRVSW